MPGEPLRLPQHHRHEQQAVPEQPRLGVRAEQVAREDEERGAEQRAPEAHEPAADQHHHHHEARLVQAHHVGIRRLLRHREQRAREPRDRRREHEHAATCRSTRGSPGSRARVSFCLMHREHAAERRVHEAPAAVHDDHERHAARSRTAPRWTCRSIVVTPSVDRQALEVEQPVLAAGHRVPLDRDEPEHLAEGDGEQRVVDAAPVRDERRHQRRRRAPRPAPRRRDRPRGWPTRAAAAVRTRRRRRRRTRRGRTTAAPSCRAAGCSPSRRS